MTLAKRLISAFINSVAYGVAAVTVCGVRIATYETACEEERGGAAAEYNGKYAPTTTTGMAYIMSSCDKRRHDINIWLCL